MLCRSAKCAALCKWRMGWPAHRCWPFAFVRCNVLGIVARSTVKYDVILDEYKLAASMPAPRSNFAAALLNGRGYIIGGYETTNTAARGIPKVGRDLGACHAVVCDVRRAIVRAPLHHPDAPAF